MTMSLHGIGPSPNTGTEPLKLTAHARAILLLSASFLLKGSIEGADLT